MDTLHAVPGPPSRAPVVALVSNKGGVGKTTVATNLAVYLRAYCEDLPILILGLDDQSTLDRMFGLEAAAAGEGNLKHVWAERSVDRLIRVGQYGVHYVPSPRDTAALKARAEDPATLGRILQRSEWSGMVIVDTKSDLEALTCNAIHAADRVILPVADRASLNEAAKVFEILESARLDPARARVLITLADARTRVEPRSSTDLRGVLAEEIRKRGWAHYETTLPRSPRVEALISEKGGPLSILHHAQGTLVHRRMRDLTEEVIDELGLGRWRSDPTRDADAGASRSARGERPRVGGWKAALLRGMRDR